VTYRPKFVKQYDDPTTSLDWFDCTMASGAMGLDYDTLGHVQKMGGQLRAVSGDHIGGTGLGTPGLEQAWHHYGQTLHVGTRGHWADALAALKGGRNVVLQGMYGALPKAYRSPLNSLSFRGAHAIDLNPEFDSAGKILMGDPLNDKWIWVPATALKAFAEALGRKEFGASTPQPIFFATSDPHTAAPPPVPDPVPYVHKVVVTTDGVNKRDTPSTAAAVHGQFSHGNSFTTTYLRRHGGRYVINGVVRTDWVGFTNGKYGTDWVARAYTTVV
jgi:hypothetical protein